MLFSSIKGLTHLPSNFMSNFFNQLLGLLRFMWVYVQVRVLNSITFIEMYYLRSENIWLDGFMFDFLQKKTVDAWVRQYVILTGFLFSERLVFDFVIRIYIDFFVNILSSYNVFEASSISSTINIILFTYFVLFILTTLTLLLYL